MRLAVLAGLLSGSSSTARIVRLFRLAPKGREAWAAAAHTDKAPADGPVPGPVRETVEMLVSVVILVVLLKSFDAEAYVIPTGSMAETLLGDQKWVVCPDCGYRFPVDCSDEVDPMKASTTIGSPAAPAPTASSTSASPGAIKAAATWPGRRSVPDPGCAGGDRILAVEVHVRPFGAARIAWTWSSSSIPGDGGFPPRGSFKDGVPINYIKRLIGLPGETIAHPQRRPLHPVARQGTALPRRPHDPEMAETPGMDPPGGCGSRTSCTRPLHDPQDADNRTSPFKTNVTIIRKPPETLLAMHRSSTTTTTRPRTWPTSTNRRAGPIAAPVPAGASDGKNGFRIAAGDAAAERWLRYPHLVRDEEMEFNVRKPKLKSALQDARLRRR